MAGIESDYSFTNTQFLIPAFTEPYCLYINNRNAELLINAELLSKKCRAFIKI